MRKIYSLVLMAATLLVGTNAWAQTNGKVKIVRTGVEYDGLQLAFDDAQDGDLLELTNNRTEAMDIAAWFGEPTSGTLENFASTDRSITLDLKGYTYTIDGTSPYKIALTRGVLTIQSTGGKGNIVSNKNGIAVYGTYLKIDAKNTPFAHLMIKENVKITSEEKTVVLNTPVTPSEASSSWKWNTYPLDYNCCIFPVSQHGISNGARIDVFGELVGKKYAVQVSGNIRSSREFINEDGSRKTVYYSGVEQPSNLEIFPIYWKKSDTEELYLPGTTLTDKTKNGTTGTPTYYGGTSYYYNSTISNTDDYVLAWGDDASYSSYVHIHPSAILTTNNPTSPNATAFYSAGYARCYIEGTCKGSTGVYVKGGEVELHDAQVSSNYADPYVPADGSRNSGVNAGGSGVVVESNKGWTGNMEVTVSGDTYVEGSTGYAIDESVTSSPTTKVDIINIEGGTFVGGSEGTVTISETTVIANQQDPEDVQIIIKGGTMTNGENNIGTQDLETFLGSQDNNTHVTTVTVDGKTTMVVSEGTPPSTANSVTGATDNTSIKWQNSSTTSETLTSDKSLKELEINEDYVQTLILGDVTTDPSNPVYVTFTVDRIIMGQNAQIIVNPGSKLIVKGDQGIVAPKTSNIILKTNETTPAEFLFKPSVSSNRHPNATVQLIANSYTSATNPSADYRYQRFGVPTHTALKGLTAKNPSTNTDVQMFVRKYENNGWLTIGYINVPGQSFNYSKMNDPFGYYILQCNVPEVGTLVSMSGELVGNVDASLTTGLNSNGWSTFTNSYSAKLNMLAMMDMFAGLNVASSAAIYFQTNLTGSDNTLTWGVFNLATIHFDDVPTELNPMQAFLIKDPNVTVQSMNLNYNTMVWNPATGSEAPQRAISNLTKMAVKVYDDANIQRDAVYMLQADQFSEDMDQGYDAVKYMNENINLYVMNDERLVTMATDNLAGHYLGFSCEKGGIYTLSFEQLAGDLFTLVDLENNATMDINEGFSYQFEVASNTTDDYRFLIVERQNAPTDLDSVNETVVKENGIYTVTGQYMGNMSVWNTLPAGLYIVNGEKKVK